MRLILLALFLVSLAGCSGGTGEPVTTLADFSSGGEASRSLVLNGPPPQTDDIQRFRLALWENVALETRCGGCHVQDQQSPSFARNDDINLAYAETNTVVNLSEPSQSRMVEKVAGGHNCWLESNQACADILTTWIANWAGEAASTGTTIELRAPVDKAPGASKSFPADSSAFGSTIHPILRAWCVGCHVDTAAVPVSPYFASPDVDAAYEAARTKIEIDHPENSRFVVRLGSEFHNCWSDCADNAATMLAAVKSFADSIPETEINPDFVTSRALTLFDGIVSSGGGRHDTNVIAFYQFKAMTGTTAFDTSGVDPSLDLTFSGNVTWVGGWGIQLADGGRVQGSTTASAKLHDLITGTGEYSIEAWVAPGNVTQEDARIVSYSGSTTARNFTIGQTLYNYDFMARSQDSNANGDPALSTPDADEVLQASLQHVVATFDPSNGRQLYVNGERIDVSDDIKGSLSDWDDTFAFVLGNEVSGDRPWQGVIKLVAIHNRALTASQVRDNFEAGVGQQFYLLFGVSQLIDVPDAYVVMKVSQYDNYSYLFSEPFFISLDASAAPTGVAVRGMRVGINGREPEVGQAFRNLDLTLGGAAYSSESGQQLSSIGTVFGIEKGPESDEFFLTFEQFGDNYDVRLEPIPDPLPGPTPLPAEPDIGLKMFDEINASFAAMTGVPMSNPQVADTFQTVRRQLPSVPGVQGFLSSQQMGITQLAIRYCNQLVEDSSLRSAKFPGFNFGADVATAFDAAGRDALFDPLLDSALGINVATAPNRTDTRAELDNLVTRLASGGGDSTRTRTIAKASCAAAIGTAATLLQ